MKKLQFSIQIAAPKERIWEALWEDKNYRLWTAAFQEGSHYEGSLEKGTEIKYFGPNNNGMYGKVEDHVPFERIYFLHKGEIKDGEKLHETYGNDAIERYDLETLENGDSELTTSMNAPEEYIGYFADVFPKALKTVKDIAQKS